MDSRDSIIERPSTNKSKNEEARSSVSSKYYMLSKYFILINYK